MLDYRVYVKINGVQYDLSESTPLQIIDIDNLGAASATRITERSPAQDGDTDIDRVLSARIMPIIVQAIPNATYTYHEIRQLINKLFKATNANMTLGIKFATGELYEIGVKSVGGVEMPINLANHSVLKIGVTLRAANPTFYNPVQQLINFGLTGAGATLVPTAIPMEIGGSLLDQTVILNYAGTYRDFPVITINGPITDPVLYNLTTGLKIDLTGINIGSGSYYTIDLRFGRKAVYRNGDPNDNRIYEVTSDSNLASFAIEADPDVPSGVNVFRVTATGLTNATALYIQYYNRFDGI